MNRIHLILTCFTLLISACAPTATLSNPQPETLPVPSPTPIDAIATPAPTATSEASPPEPLPLLRQAQTANPQRYQYAVEQGAQILPATDGKSFYVWWLPEGSHPASPPPIIVTLHGHASWALDEFFLWHPYATERGYGILALQWWFGGGEAMNDYYLPQEMYPLIARILQANHVRPQTVLLHGFSRGSANTYGLTALDRASGNAFFLLTIANAGGKAGDFPINQSIEKGDFGPQPFANTHWVMVCGMNDPHPDRDGCPAMNATRDWVLQYGGVVDLLIADPNGDHGVFHRNPGNVDAALDVFAQLLTP
ncbi:MAG: hypothetical protein WHX52_12630 [Anaerolineae bacterium]